MRLFVPLLILSLAACDGDATDATDIDTGTESDTAYAGEGVAWADKDAGQRQAYMGAVVLPTMKPKFQAHDADTFADMTCTTCHGADGADNDWAMPAVFALDPADMPVPNDGAGAKFMYEDVAPSMATLLEMEPFDPNTGEGFGCFGCHQVK